MKDSFKENPYLTIVVAVRNDNYGGDFIARLQKFVSWNTYLLEKHQVGTEIILVNWNPLADKPPLKELIKWEEDRKCVSYRIITVPSEIHESFSDASQRKVLPMYEYLAKNTGIRRARGTYVLAMNPDIVLPEEIIRFFSKKLLDKSSYYRANRVDYAKDIKDVKKLWLKGFTYKISSSDLFGPLNVFSIAKFQIYSNLRMLLYSFIRSFNFLWKQPLHHKAEYKYHCNVSGDFMLMHKDSWHKLKGNAENTYLALHTDALTVVAAATSGLHEFTFSHPIHHKEHKRRFNAEEKGNQENRTAYLYFQEEALNMIKAKKATIYNSEDWGLINFDLEEITF